MAEETRTTCPYCGVGCGVIVRRNEDGGATSVRGDPDHPANFGRLCSKGSALAETLGLDGRALAPKLHGKTASWDDALTFVASRLQQTIDVHGPDSVAFYLSGQMLTEDYYVANKLMKGFIGSANIDTNSRLCMASSVAGHRRAFGSDTVPGTYADIELADLVVIVGSNMAWCHPVLFQRLAAAKATRPEMRVVVIDPRRTATSEIADLHLAIRADSDVALFNGLLSQLATRDCIDSSYVGDHTAGFDAALAAAGRPGLERLCAQTGLAPEELVVFFDLFVHTEKVVTLYSQGVNQSTAGSDKVNAILNCHLATGRIGRPGMGPFSLTGQPNAMGGREVGGLANMLAAHMALENPEDRDRVQRFWRAPTMAERPGLKAVDLFDAVAEGRIKALWIMATNPVVSLPEANRVRAAIAACPLVIVSDIQEDTDTARLAHVLLPSLGWGEKAGTVTNSERRISRQRPFEAGPGQARADWWQFAEIGKRMGYGHAFSYQGPHEIFAEHAALSGFENDGRRDFDISAQAGIDRAGYDALQPFQWPQPAGTSAQERRFFGDGHFYHGDGRARFVAVTTREERRTSDDFPFVFNTGRIRDQWHTMTRTGKSPRLSSHLAEPYAEIHPADAATAGINEADVVRISTAEGESILVRALLTKRQARGNVFCPMHWTGETASLGRVNSLLAARVDPQSGQPGLKHGAVRIERADMSIHGFLVCTNRPQGLEMPYWAVARTAQGWRAEVAGATPGASWEDWLRRIADLPETAELIAIRDSAGRTARIAAFGNNRLLAALIVADRPVEASRDWLASQLGGLFEERQRRADVIAGRPGKAGVDKGPIVCACGGVGLNEILTAQAGGCASVEAIGKATGAGSHCGSCRPEIRHIIERSLAVAAE